MKALLRIVQAFQEAIFPVKCPVCESFFHWKQDGGEFHEAEDGSGAGKTLSGARALFESTMSGCLCPQCRKKFSPALSPLCRRCGALFATPEGEDHLCSSCITRPKHFQKARSAGIYDTTLMRMIHRFKYEGDIHLAHPLGKLLLGTYRQFFEQGAPDLIVPVPLHTRRFRERGFNQAYLLVRDWRKLESGAPPVEKDILFRSHRTQPQTGLKRKDRIRNIKNAFSVNPKAAIAGKKVLLVDDVYTTGATLDECARVLLEAGAERVDAVTLARAV
jgi:ComF family protein